MGLVVVKLMLHMKELVHYAVKQGMAVLCMRADADRSYLVLVMECFLAPLSSTLGMISLNPSVFADDTSSSLLVTIPRWCVKWIGNEI